MKSIRRVRATVEIFELFHLANIHITDSRDFPGKV
jgi:hypothetical protein